LAAVRDPLQNLSDSASSPTAVFSSAFRLLTLADFTGVMSLKLSFATDDFRTSD
jgi:hypothetical protein